MEVLEREFYFVWSLTFSMVTCNTLKCTHTCTTAGTRCAHFSWQLNNLWFQNHTLTSLIHYMSVMNPSGELILTTLKKVSYNFNGVLLLFACQRLTKILMINPDFFHHLSFKLHLVLVAVVSIDRILRSSLCVHIQHCCLHTSAFLTLVCPFGNRYDPYNIRDVPHWTFSLFWDKQLHLSARNKVYYELYHIYVFFVKLSREIVKYFKNTI